MHALKNRTFPHLAFVLALAAALLSCQTALIKEKQTDSYLSLAVSSIRQCNYRGALGMLQKAADLSRKDPLIRHALASVYFLMKEPARAAKEYRKALSLKKHFTEARVDLARVYIEAGLLDKALFELAVAEQDIAYQNHIKLIGNKGLALFKKGAFKEAKKQFEEIRQISSKNIDRSFAFLYLGRIHLSEGDLSAAEDFFIKAFAERQKVSGRSCKRPDFEEQYFLAETYRRQKQFARMRYQLKVFLNRTKAGAPFRKEARALLKKQEAPDRLTKGAKKKKKKKKPRRKETGAPGRVTADGAAAARLTTDRISAVPETPTGPPAPEKSAPATPVLKAADSGDKKVSDKKSRSKAAAGSSDGG